MFVVKDGEFETLAKRAIHRAKAEEEEEEEEEEEMDKEGYSCEEPEVVGEDDFDKIPLFAYKWYVKRAARREVDDGGQMGGNIAPLECEEMDEEKPEDIGVFITIRRTRLRALIQKAFVKSQQRLLRHILMWTY